MYQIEVQNEQGEWELKLTCSKGLVEGHVDLYKTLFKREVRVINLTPEGARMSAPVRAKRDIDLSPFFKDSPIRGLSLICYQTGFTEEEVVEWVTEHDGEIIVWKPKGSARIFCSMKQKHIPNIFEEYQ
jgi:hypothetical protein